MSIHPARQGARRAVAFPRAPRSAIIAALLAAGGVRPWGGRVRWGCVLASSDPEGAHSHYGRFFDLSLDLLCIAGFDGFFKRINPAFERVTGHSAAALLAVPYLDFVHPDDRAATIAEAARLTTGAEMVAFENRYRCADGTYRWLAWTATAIPEEALIYAVARDATERTREREASRFLAEAGAVLAGSLDVRTTLATVARLAVPRLADWCAIDLLETDGTTSRMVIVAEGSGKEGLARELAERYPPDPRSANIMTRIMQEQRSEFRPAIPEAFIAANARDNRHREILLGLGLAGQMIIPLVARGRAIGLIGFAAATPARRYDERDLALAEDLARRAALAVDNARLYREAQAAVRARDQFLTIATHELRTPLTTIRGSAELLLRRVRRAEAPPDRAMIIERLERLLDGADRMTSLASRLLDVTRMQAGAFEVARQPADLAALVGTVVARTRQGLLPAARTTIVYAGPDGPLVGEFDPLQVEQVLVNLLDNAIKYQQEGGTVRVALARESGGATIAVSDEGIGIAPEDLPRLFAPFARGENAVSDNIGGVGIGLYISDQIVRRHGGRIEVRSEVGRGTTFVVRLPLA